MFRVHAELLRVIEGSGCFPHDDSQSSEVDLPPVVDVRFRHSGSGHSTEEIANIVTYVLADCSFMRQGV